MIGAIIGDMVGSVYERDNIKTKDFPLFVKESHFTDDTVMSIAIADGLLNTKEFNEENIKKNIIESMKKWGRLFPNVGYGRKFREWFMGDEQKPYNSYGNGSAMRVSSVGWLFKDLEGTRRVARWTAEVTHNHIEGIKGAEAIASAIFLAKNQATRDEIKAYIEREFGYDLNRELDVIRYDYSFDVSCQGSVPEAIICFLESKNFEDCIRNAISLGGDSDTIAAMAGSIARAFYDTPTILEVIAKTKLDPRMIRVLDQFNAVIKHRDPYFTFNDIILEKIKLHKQDPSKENTVGALEAIRFTMMRNGHLLVPVHEVKVNGKKTFAFNTVKSEDGKNFYVGFLSNEHLDKNKDKLCMSVFTQKLLEVTMQTKEVDGLIINPWSNQFILAKPGVDVILKAAKQEIEKNQAKAKAN